MGNFGSFYKGDKKKPKRANLEKKAQILSSQSGGFYLPKVEIIGKGKKDKQQ